MKRLEVALLALAALALLAAPLFGDAVLHAGDLSFQSGPRDRFLRERILAGELPRWAPAIYGGVPTAGCPELAAFYPPDLAATLLFAGRARAVSVLFHLLVAVFGARNLAARLGASRPGAAIAGVVYGLGGAVVSAHVSLMLGSAAWFPWIALGVLGSPVVLALSLALCALSGEPQGCAVGAVIGLVLAAGEGRAALGRGLARLVAGAVASLALAAIQMLPAILHVPETIRSRALPLDAATRWSLWPPELAGLALPFAFGSAGWGNTCFPRVSPDAERAWSECLYAGPIALALAAVGLASLARSALARGGLGLGLVFLPLALGKFAPFYAVFHRATGGTFRYPAKLAVPLALGVALLAAAGASHVRDGRRLFLGGLVAFVLGGIALVLSGHDVLAPQGLRLAATALGGLVLACRGRLAWALALLVLVDVATGTRPAILTAPRAALFEEPLFARVLREIAEREGVPARVVTTEGAEAPGEDESSARAPVDALAPNSGMPFGVLAQGGFLANPPLRGITLELRPELGPPWRRAVLRGARFAVIGPGEAWPARPLVEAGPRRLVRLEGAPPWAAVYGRVRPVASLKEVMKLIGAHEPRREALVEGAPMPLEGGEPVAVPLTSPFGLHGFELDVSAAPPGWLVVREAWARGWTATVDGVAAEVLPADGLFRAVAVPRGARRVAFRYEAPGLALGAATSLATVILGIAFLVWRRR